MELLESSLQSLTSKEKKSFRKNIELHRDAQLTLQLYDLLIQEKTIEDTLIRKKLFGKEERSNQAYYMLRSRLYQKLIEFLKDEFNNTDSSGEAQAASLIYVAQNFINRKAYQPADDLLHRAEKLAEEAHLFEHLALIYAKRLAHADHLVANFDELVSKATSNLEIREQMYKLNIAFASIRKKLQELRRSGSHFDPEETIRETLKPFHFTRQNIRTNPVFMHRLAELWRSVIISAKSYSAFKPFLLKAYRSLEQANAFHGYNKHLQLDLVYYITHVNYRTRDFTEATKWNLLLEKFLQEEQFQGHPTKIKLIGIKAGIAFYSKKPQDAISILVDYLNDNAKLSNTREYLNLQLNFAVYTFFQKSYSEANRILRSLPAKNKQKEDLMGHEWYFKHDLIEVIFQYELGNTDIAWKYLQRIKSQYAQLLQEPNYQRVQKFIGFIEIFLNNPEEITQPNFAQRVQESNIKLVGENEDIQAILFFCWLRSKMQRKDCYEVLLERVYEME
ncbi:MAG: hypothetical protein IPP69_11375 [Flavobacteriales bacterium]|nr:hypothetical protein [Flavobacteriales bacterium]